MVPKYDRYTTSELPESLYTGRFALRIPGTLVYVPILTLWCCWAPDMVTFSEH